MTPKFALAFLIICAGAFILPFDGDAGAIICAAAVVVFAMSGDEDNLTDESEYRSDKDGE